MHQNKDVHEIVELPFHRIYSFAFQSLRDNSELLYDNLDFRISQHRYTSIKKL